MKQFLALLFIALFALSSCGNKGDYSGKKMDKPNNLWDQFSYSYGLNLGKNAKRDSFKINPDYVAYGIYQGLHEDSTKFLLTQAEMDSAQKKFQDILMKKQQAMMKSEQEANAKAGEKNKAEGEKFLSENKNKPGVKTTSSGLQYEILKEGTGKKPVDGEQVKIQVIAKYLDGKEFDNTYQRQGAVTLPLIKGQIMPGWYEALTMMPVGSKWRLFLPPNLGLGVNGQPPTIPPNATLIFELELVSIEGKAKPMQPPPGMQAPPPGAMQPGPGGPRPH